jgi:hypothetical protein
VKHGKKSVQLRDLFIFEQKIAKRRWNFSTKGKNNTDWKSDTSQHQSLRVPLRPSVKIALKKAAARPAATSAEPCRSRPTL